MIEAVIFDMDGLLIDSEFVTYQAYKDICSSYNRPFDLVYYSTFLGRNAAYIESSLAIYLGDPELAKSIMKEVHLQVERLYKTEGIPVKRGAVELIDFLKTQKIKIGLATSSHRQKATYILKMAGILEAFNAMTCGDEVALSKPDPEIFIKTGIALDSVPGKTLVLEDSESGIIGAHQAGMICIHVPDLKDASRDIKKKALHVAQDLLEVKSIIEKMLTN